MNSISSIFITRTRSQPRNKTTNEAYFYRITDLASLVRSYSLYDIIYEKSNGKQQKTHRRNSSKIQSINHRKRQNQYHSTLIRTGTGTSMKGGEIKLFVCAQIFPLNETMLSSMIKCCPMYNIRSI